MLKCGFLLALWGVESSNSRASFVVVLEKRRMLF